MSVLQFRPVAAEYSTPLDRMILVSANPNLLHVYEPATGADATIALSKPPLSVAVSPDGTHATVGHDNLVSYVDLISGTVEKTVVIALSAKTVTMSANWIYAMPPFVFSSNGASINIETGTVTPFTNFPAQGAKFDPLVNALYAARGGSPDDVVKFDVSAGPMKYPTDSPYHGDYSICGPVFLSPDGARVYTSCGTLFRASADPAQDMRYITSMAGANSIQSLSESAAIERIAVIQFATEFHQTNANDNVVSLYESNYLNPVAQFGLSAFLSDGRTYKARGKSVFFSADSKTLYAVTQADAGSGLINDFAIQSIAIAASAECPATFSAGTATIDADGASGTVNIASTAGCAYQAVSDASWLQILSGGYGAGNGTLTYVVRANNGDSRNGVITLGDQKFSVSQSAAAAPSPLTRLPYNVVSAEYNKTLEKLIIVSANPNELHLYDPLTASERTVSLVLPPLSLSVATDGRYAAVGHDGWVSYVDVQSLAVLSVFHTTSIVRNLLWGNNGYIYLFPSGIRFDVYSLELQTGTITSTFASIRGQVPRLSPDGKSMYTGGDELGRWSIGQGVAQNAYRQYISGGSCGSLWVAAGTSQLITACGTVYRISAVAAEDLQKTGQLGRTGIIWADESASKRLIATIPGSYYGPSLPITQIQIYGDDLLDFQGNIRLPKLTVANSLYAMYGKYVFWNGDSSTLVTLLKADDAANLLSSYAVALLSPSTTGQNPFTVRDRGVVSFTTTGESAATMVGSARVQPLFGQVSPSAMAIFASRQNGVLVSEATVPASSSIRVGRIFAEVSNGVTTGLAIANPNSSPAVVSFYFTDGEGMNFGSGFTVIPPNGQIASVLNDSPFNGVSDFSGTFTFSSDRPVAAIALRGLINARSEIVWTTLPVGGINSVLGTQVLAYFADGAGWTTQFVLVNPTELTISGMLQFLSPGSAVSGASPLPITVEGQTATSFVYTIPPRTSRNLVTSGLSQNLIAGSVRIVPDPRSPSGPTAVAIFSEKTASGMTISEAGVPVTTASQTFQMYAEMSGDAALIQTGVAMTNTTSAAVTVKLELTYLSGEPTGLTGTATVPANGLVRMFLGEIQGFEKLPTPFRGVLRITSSNPTGIYVLGLRTRYNERREFLITTTMPAPQTFSSSSADLLFPHFADGGGYTTQFILIGTSSNGSIGTLQFLSRPGDPITLPVTRLPD